MSIRTLAVCETCVAKSSLLTITEQQISPSTTPNNFQSGGIPTSHPGTFMGVFVPPKPEKAPPRARKPKDPNALNRSRGRPQKDASQSSTKQETDASTSDSGSEELQRVEMPEPTPDLLRGPRPENAEYKVIYDVAVALWSPRNKPAVAEKVRKGIALFGDVVKQQRDAWKVKNEALKQAELANTTAIPSLKQEVAQFRKVIETVAVQALRFGHPAHLAKYVYPRLRLHLPSFCLEVESEKVLSYLGSYLDSHLCSVEKNRSVLLHPLQSHNKGLYNGNGTKLRCAAKCTTRCNRAVLRRPKWA